jgi:hypothetical protein
LDSSCGVAFTRRSARAGQKDDAIKSSAPSCGILAVSLLNDRLVIQVMESVSLGTETREYFGTLSAEIVRAVSESRASNNAHDNEYYCTPSPTVKNPSGNVKKGDFLPCCGPLCGIRPCLTSGLTFVTLRPWKRTLSACDSRPTPRTAKSDFLLGRFLASEEDTHEEAAFDTRSWLWLSVAPGI